MYVPYGNADHRPAARVLENGYFSCYDYFGCVNNITLRIIITTHYFAGELFALV